MIRLTETTPDLTGYTVGVNLAGHAVIWKPPTASGERFAGAVRRQFDPVLWAALVGLVEGS